MSDTIIIAEAGVNHNGDIRLAKELIDVAAESGADYVKFQSFRAENLVTRDAGKAAYQLANQPDLPDESQFAMLKKLELSASNHRVLRDHCDSRNIRFLSTAFDLGGIELLRDLGVTLGKIPSGEITNLPFLEGIAANFESLVMSTGMANESEVRAALDVLEHAGAKRDHITVLHCNTEYPTPMTDVNLRAMLTIRETFGVRVGYSDHTAGIEIPVAAVALGASVIEKHFTLDRSMDGPDHKASLEPDELRQMVASIRNVEMALGSSIKQPSASETRNIGIARRSIVAAKNIKNGERFSEENLTAKRPGTGVSPMRWRDVLGQAANRDYAADELIDADVLL